VYPPCNMMTNNTEWDKGVLPPQRRCRSPTLHLQGPGQPHVPLGVRVSDDVGRTKLVPYMVALKALREAELTAVAILAQCHWPR
jgi:hypothetical protein